MSVGTNPDIDADGERRATIARRTAPRIPRTLRTTVAVEGGTQIDCAVNDISATGAGLASLTAILPGTAVTIDLPGIGAVESEVAWLSGVRIGIAFTAPIDPARIVVPPKVAAPIDRRASGAD